MPVSYAPLESTRLTRIIQALSDVRQNPQNLLMYNRTAKSNATDGEIIARYIQYNPVADIIADDERAVVYNTGKFSFESVAIPNVKRGSAIRQEQLNQLQSIAANGGIGNTDAANAGTLFNGWRNRELANLDLAVKQRMEAMIIGMQLDSFSYNRFGIQLSNVTWGMPADLKVTPAVTWDTAATADALTDILTVKRLASIRYGETYNRVTMSGAALIYMINQVATQNKMRFVLPPSVSSNLLPLQNNDYMKNLISTYLNMEIEVYDGRYWQQNTDGTTTSVPFLPINKVILSSKADDNDASVMDLANAIVTESIVADLVDGSPVGSFGGPQFGPVAYTTLSDAQLNPPGVTMWACARCFPRKQRLQATSVLTVGAFGENVPFSVPF